MKWPKYEWYWESALPFELKPPTQARQMVPGGTAAPKPEILPPGVPTKPQQPETPSMGEILLRGNGGTDLMFMWPTMDLPTTKPKFGRY